MAKDSFVNTPMDMIATPPKGNKGGPGVYGGEDVAPFSNYKRTPSPNAVPEKLYDGSLPKTKESAILPNELPKDVK